MGKASQTILGGLEIAVGITMAFLAPGVGSLIGGYLIMAGVGTTLGSIGTLLQPTPPGGLSTAARNPIMPWNVVYGRAKVGGTIVYFNEHGDDDKYLDIVIVIASHRCQAVDSLLFDNQRVLINPVTHSSYSPTQQTVNILSISRVGGWVTVHIDATLGDLQDGDQVQVKNVHGQATNDKSLNGRVYVTVIDSTHFTYLSGGLDVSLTGTGQVRTMWADYRAKVYAEFLLGDQTATFQGMLTGTPYDGGPDPDAVTVTDNPWTDQHLLTGRTCAFLRLHYNDEVFSGGLPQISFKVRGKSDIYDPRDGGTVLGRPSVTLNGWGPGEHEAMYEGGVDLGYTWGTDSGTTHSYGSPGYATDGNFSSAANVGYRHTHKYAGCIWTFDAITLASTSYLNIFSEVPAYGPGSLRSARIDYTLDGGATWNELYDAPIRARQWDHVTLSAGQDTTAIQVMAFLDSHDDMAHAVYDIHIGTAVATFPGYTENPALCIADYLSNVPFGFRANYGTEIPEAPLITAANICDEDVALANGDTEPRYTLNGQFQLSTSRGEVLQNMLTSCAGRLTYSAGQFIIHPAAWVGPSLTIGPTITGGTLTIVTAFTEGIASGSSTGHAGDAAVTTGAVGIGTGTTVFGPPPNHGTYAKRTNTIVLTAAQLDGLHVNCYIDGTYSGNDCFCDADPPAEMLIYDCYVDVSYSDATTGRLVPTSTNYVTGAGGFIEDAGQAVDGDPDTYAKLTRVHYSSAGVPGVFQLLTFVESTGDGTPTTDADAMAKSAEALAIAAGSFQWHSRVPIRDLYNGVKGTYISPANGWQNSDFPPYAQDELHGYASDANLAHDGGDRRWLELQLPFTISPAMAQRLAKIELLRRRQQGSGTFAFNLSLYKTTALDVVSLTLPILGWNHKLLEVSAHRLVFNRDQQTPFLSCELDLHDTAPSVYEWSASEELTPQGLDQSGLPDTKTVAAPTSVDAVSGTGTSVVGADGVARSRILVSWAAPADGYVLNGGHIEVQYQKTGDTEWIGLPTVDPTVTQVYIDGVTDGETYHVQVRAVNAAGVPSAYEAAPDVTVSGTATVLPPSSLDSGGASTGEVLTWNGSAWVPSPSSSIAFVSQTPSGTMNGANLSFTLSFTPNPTGSLFLFLNGVEQVPGIDYTASGTTVTYTTAPKSTDEHVAQYTH
jgi:hypothetical protein